MKIAIAGNPNCGKTTLFNALTGSRQKVGNWPGVTVEKKEGQFISNTTPVDITDLPGIYSLSAFTEDEKVAVRYLLEKNYDLVVNVLDSVNLERNLFLTTQLITMKVPVIVVLNMYDLAKKASIEIESSVLKKRLGCPVLSVSALSKGDVESLKKIIIEYKPPAEKTFHVALPPELEEEISLLNDILSQGESFKTWDSRWLSQKVLEEEPFIEEFTRVPSAIDITVLTESRKRIEQRFGQPCDVVVAQKYYDKITTMIQEALRKPIETESISSRIDSVVMHKVWGFPFFLVIMYMVFWCTINLGGVFIDFFDILFGAVFVDSTRWLLESMSAPAFLITIISDGVGGGIQTLTTFVPVIFILFAIIALLESTGYMSRAAVVMDRLMRLMGLPGKAFIPLLIGFGCTVPAIMATRTLENRRDRILTSFMAPFMSCGARMPVYALFAAAFFTEGGQNVIFILYLLGMFIAALTGLFLKNTVFKTEPSPFIMEQSNYHMPRFKNVFMPAVYKLSAFLKKSGKVLLPIIIVLGVLNSLGTDGTFGHQDKKDSVLSVMGKSITPVFHPMGLNDDNWQATVGLFTGLFAKEVIVGSLNSLYLQENTVTSDEPAADFSFSKSVSDAFVSVKDNFLGLHETLLDPFGITVSDASDTQVAAESMAVESGIYATMQVKFGMGYTGKVAAFAYLIFVLLYFPCIVAVSAAWKEIGARLSLIQIYYSTMLAWVLAVLYYQVMVGHSAFWIIFSLAFASLSIWGIVHYAGKSEVFVREASGKLELG